MTDPSASILAVTSELPWPLDRGGHLRSYHMLQGLARRFRVRLVAGVTDPRLMGEDAFRSAGITLYPVLLSHRRLAAELWRATRAAMASEPYVFYQRHNRRGMRRAVQRELDRETPDVFYCDHLDSWLFAEGAKGRRIVVDLHNVYSSLVQRTAEEQHGALKRLYLRYQAPLVARIERQVVDTADLVFAVSEGDATELSCGRSSNVQVVPNGVEVLAYEGLPSGRQGGAPTVLFLGTLSWPPNVAAIRFLATVAFERVAAQVPGVRLTVVGRDPPAEVRALASRLGVDVTGGVPDVRPYLARAHVLAVPLEAGGGTRLKILEAFAAGLPVVSTPIGCEGLRVVHNEHLLIVRRAEFAEAILSLLSDAALSYRLATNARRLVREQYEWRSIADAACDHVAAAIARG